MRVSLTILFYTFLTIIASGQESGLQAKLIEENHTWRTTSSEQLDSFYFNLKPIQTTEYKSHIRISLTGQTIDLYKSGNDKYHGMLTNYITEYKTVKSKDSDYDQNIEHQYVFEQINLEQSLAEKMGEKLITTRQPEIPTDTLISAWQRSFLHCNSLVFQFNIDGKYTKQAFYCPWEQKDSIEFKDIILDNYQTLKSIFQLDSLSDLFENKLPQGKTYSRDGYRMMYKMTDQQSENWEKTQPQRDYLQSVKDTIDGFLNSELEKLNIELKDINCFEDYQLTFGKNGELRKVSIFKYNIPKLKNSLGLEDYLADKREIRKCRRKIKQIFSEIDLSFLNLEYEFYRTLSFNHKEEFWLLDVTRY